MRKTVKQRREQRRQNARFPYGLNLRSFYMQHCLAEWIRSQPVPAMPTPFLDALRKSSAPSMMIDRGALVPIGPSPMAEAMEAQRMVNEIVQLTRTQIRLSAPSEEEMQTMGMAILMNDYRRYLDEEMMKAGWGDFFLEKPSSLDTMPE